jgi:hypothetical protein
VSATTGRGLRLLGALARSWGVDHDDRGKTVWAQLGEGAPEPAAQVDGAPGAARPVSEGRTVRLVALPVRLALESDLNLDALVREFQVMEGSGTAPEARGLVPRPARCWPRTPAQRAAGTRVAHDAAARGDRLVDVEADVPEQAPAAHARLVAC